MEKEKADKIIAEYMKKIYSFSLSKTMDIDLAEELASQIILEVYKSLLKADEIQNIFGYVYRIAHNTHSKFVIEDIANKQLLREKSQEIRNKKHENDKIYEKIRTEIAYLSKNQREIAIMFYFQKLKIKEIAKITNLSEKNVTWHLIDARNHIKAGFSKKKNANNPLNIVFSEIIGRGRLGPQLIKIPFYFSKSLIQSIAYSAYHKSKTAVEIARELSTPVVFVEDEISHLVEYGFMKKIGINRYITNMYITALKKETQESLEAIYREYAKHYCEIYVPLLLQNCPLSTVNYQLSTDLYIPENDYNFYLWTLISYSTGLGVIKIEKEDELYKFYTKRKDGSNSIAFATVKDDINIDKKQFEKINENKSSTMIGNIFTGEKKNSTVWIYFSKYDDRELQPFILQIIQIFNILYDFMAGKLQKDPNNINKFVSLYENDFIVPKTTCRYTDINPHNVVAEFASVHSGPPPCPSEQSEESYPDSVNMIVTTMSREEFHSIFPPIPENLQKIAHKFETDLFSILKKHYPPNMQELTRLGAQLSHLTASSTIYILEHLLKTGILKPLKKHQKKTVNMIFFSDVLPESIDN